MIREKSFYRSFFAMWIVLVLQNVITLSVNLADNMMLGGYSESALAGVAAVNQIQFVYQQLLLAIGEAAVILGTQYYGRRNMDRIHELARIAMHTAVVLSVVLFAAASLFPRQLLLIFTTDEEIIARGMEYLGIIRYTYLIFAVAQILLATLRIVGVVRISLYLSVTALVVNCFWNWTLIYGKLGFPSLGARGAAYATLISRIVEICVLLIFTAFKEKILRLRLKEYFIFSTQLLHDYMKIMLPMMVVNALWGLNNAAQNAILGHMTARAIAANSVASTLFLLVKSTAQGSASTASFFVGRMIGEGDMKKLKTASRTMQVMFVLIGLVSGIALYFLRIPIVGMYRLEPGTREMADSFLVILSVIMVTMSYQMPVNAGIIRGGGDIRYAVTLDLVSIWGIVIPLSWVMAFVLHASPVAVVWCLNADQIFKCVPAFIKCNYGHWAKKLTRE